MSGFSSKLLALGQALEPPEVQWGDDELPPSYLCPRLRSSYSPRVAWQVRAKYQAAEGEERRPTWSRVWERPEADPLGLSLARNPNRPPRYGLKGLSGQGRRQIYRALALMEERRPLLAFWTVTLPSAALDQLAVLQSVSIFQDHLRKYLERHLKSNGLCRWAVGVVELHPARSRREGRPCPHWHLVFLGRRSRSHPWAIEREVLDRVIERALVAAGVECPAGLSWSEFLQSAGNVQPVKASARAYLSKYCTKSGNDTAPWVGTASEALLPRQWWFWTKAIRAWTLRHVLPLARAFLVWAHENRFELETRELLRSKQFDLPDPRAPATFELNWISLEHLAEVISIWQTAVWDAEWHQSFRSRHCQH